MRPSRPVQPNQIDLLADAPANALLFSALCEQIKPDSPLFGPIRKDHGLVTLQIVINGVELPNPLTALEKVAKAWGEQSEAEVGRRALEMVTEAGLTGVHEAFEKTRRTMEEARRELKRVLVEKAGAQFYGDDD
jgi:hypothetical protein